MTTQIQTLWYAFIHTHFFALCTGYEWSKTCRRLHPQQLEELQICRWGPRRISEPWGGHFKAWGTSPYASITNNFTIYDASQPWLLTECRLALDLDLCHTLFRCDVGSKGKTLYKKKKQENAIKRFKSRFLYHACHYCFVGKATQPWSGEWEEKKSRSN